MAKHDELTDLQIEEICRIYKECKNQIETAKLSGHSITTVSKYLIANGYGCGQGGNPTRRKITDDEIIADIQAGYTRQEIADRHGVHVENLARRMKRLGVHARYADNFRKTLPRSEFGDCWHYIHGRALKVQKDFPDFEYLESRRINNNTQHRLKCKHCGKVIVRSDLRGNIRCDCYQNRKKKQKELDQRRADVVRLLYCIAELKNPKICCQCGKEFHSPYETKAYCSEVCVRRAKMKRRKERDPEKFRDARRRANASHGHHISRAKKYGCEYIYGISLAKVIKKDNGICQICGEPVDKTDRTKICVGPKYPSIDHIIPLSKGGAHTWENVQLAHIYCNSVKRDLFTVKREEV